MKIEEFLVLIIYIFQESNVTQNITYITNKIIKTTITVHMCRNAGVVVIEHNMNKVFYPLITATGLSFTHNLLIPAA
jgi:hypothetical protein